MPNQRLAVLVMIQVYKENHDGPKGMLAKSHGQGVWIHQGRYFASKVERVCMF